MDTSQVPRDFIDILSLLNEHRVRYLLIGGYAVIYHGYPRNTGDLDIWIAVSPENAEATRQALAEFGFDDPALTVELLMRHWQIIRMGYPPFRVEITTGISGVEFDDCWGRRVEAQIGGLRVSIISLADLKVNKAASGRHKDLTDLDYLP